MNTDELKALAVSLFEHMEPLVVNAAKAAAGIVSGAAAPVVTTVVDAVDALVRVHNPSITANETAAGIAPKPADVPSDPMAALVARVTALEIHVAALTAQTGNSTAQSFVNTKAAMTAAVAAAAKPTVN